MHENRFIALELPAIAKKASPSLTNYDLTADLSYADRLKERHKREASIVDYEVKLT